MRVPSRNKEANKRAAVAATSVQTRIEIGRFSIIDGVVF